MASGRLILPLADAALLATAQPASGAQLSVFEAGTDTLAALFADVALDTAILNPQTADAAGRFYDQTTVIWADSAVAYDCQLTFSDGESFFYPNIFLLGALESASGFAPINSPTFTGVPQAPTPAANDNSSKIATTAFVQQAISALSATVSALSTTVAGLSSSFTNAFSINPGATGHVILFGFCLNWGTYNLASPGGSNQPVTFDHTFSAAIHAFIAVDGAATQMIGYTGLNNGGMTVNKGASDSGSTRSGTYYAIGQA